MIRILAAAIVAAVCALPVSAGSFPASGGHTVLERPASSQLEVIGGPRNRGAGSYFCAAAEAAVARMGASGQDRLRIEGMPRGGNGAIFTLQRGPAAEQRIQILGRRGSSLSVAAARGLCRF